MKLLLLSAILVLSTSCGKVMSDGKNGKDGLNGATGAQGEVGQTGAAGIDAAIIPVRFCPGLVDSYGVQYSEHGLCIADQIYAVYSANSKAALVPLSEGNYQTTTPQGTNCNFTVKPNCVIE